MMVIAYGTIIDEQSDHYNSGSVSDIGQYNRLGEVQNITGGYREKFAPDDSDPGRDAEANTFSGIFGLLVNMFTMFDIFIGENGMIQQAMVQLGIPTQYVAGIMMMVLVGIATSLAAIIFRLARRDI